MNHNGGIEMKTLFTHLILGGIKIRSDYWVCDSSMDWESEPPFLSMTPRYSFCLSKIPSLSLKNIKKKEKQNWNL